MARVILSRGGARFKDRVLPAAMERVQRKPAGTDDGARPMPDILVAVLTGGLPAEAACTGALADGVHSADVILNLLAPPSIEDRTLFHCCSAAVADPELTCASGLCRGARVCFRPLAMW